MAIDPAAMLRDCELAKPGTVAARLSAHVLALVAERQRYALADEIRGRLLERWDQTDPEIQRRIVAKFAIDLVAAEAERDTLRGLLGDALCYLPVQGQLFNEITDALATNPPHVPPVVGPT